jgi:hypothetical protein
MNRLTSRAFSLLPAVLCAGILTVSTAASAAVHQWSFSDVSFSDGGSAEGSFFYDGANFFNWDITTFRQPNAPGFPEVLGYHYDNTTSSLGVGGGNSLYLQRNDGGAGNFLQLFFGASLASGAPVLGSALERTLSPGGSDNGHSSDSFTLISSVVSEVPVTSPVPEPSVLVMGLFGLSLLGAAAWRRQQRTAPPRTEPH